jgi:hypothetical protein
LMLAQAKPGKQAIGHFFHLGARWHVANIERDHDVVAGSLDTDALVRGCFHNDRCDSQIDDREAAACDPFDALGVTPIGASGQIGS